MAGIFTDVTVAAKLGVRALGRRVRAEIEPPPDLDAFRREMEGVLSGAAHSIVGEYRWIDLSATQPPWLGTGLKIEAGDELSFFVNGRVYANRLLDIYVPNSVQLWYRVGDRGAVSRGTRSSHSFRAEHDGELLFGNYFPNDWADPQGARKQDDRIYRDVSGGLRILVIRWTGSAAEGLQALSQLADPGGYFSSEIERIEQGDTTPSGWSYLWHLGPAEIYRQHNDEGRECIHCRTHEDVGILQKEVDLPLDETSEVSWRWCVAQLPSTLREDTVPSHDYLSLAVEFDNGRDITYYWSSNLPVGTGYDCPLPNWQGIEYHVVIRSGEEGLGHWHDERRNLYSDYQRYMGEPPERITRVWLIANCIFQRSEGVCDYSDIVLHQGGKSVRVL
jgi:hypothetical protein